MKEFALLQNGVLADVVLEENALHGMTEMAEIFCEDIRRVTDKEVKVRRHITKEMKQVLLVTTCGSSEWLNQFEKEGSIDLSGVRGKREVYGIFCVESRKLPDTKVLVIAGSDKRGTIYGMFRLSEEMGVSPWVFWADAVPKHREEIVFGKEVLMVSKEPSVRYRGFFINDEQPCFGNWAKEKYGSVKPGPELYRHIFELLLRLKGNYIWPAMWRSDFTLDNIENARLADRMGVIVGASHHEPCCRSGGEFQKLRHENKVYGEDWSFLSNADGIREFWKDGLIRNREFESLITIGMRGENDSYLMPEDATLEDNINVLKSAIIEQKRLIKEYADTKHPQLLAIYKEVEDYYQGDENTPGLKDWDVIKDDIMMLCDDNFGNLRTLPGKEERKHPGGFGMYYHFDYYGGPVSYLWINSTPLTKIWEQMTMAYDFGVRDAWIVNVGDIKNQELPLSYFLDLAYDYGKWGSSSINRTEQYTREWLHRLGFTEPCFQGLSELVEEYTKWNGSCRPEVLKYNTYHPVHFNEAGKMLHRVKETAEKAERLWEQLKGVSSLANCFYELVYYPVVASANVIEMQISAGLNQFYVKQRKKKGNKYASVVESCIQKDRRLVEEYHSINGGKWNHMQSVFHIGFIGWNDEEWQYPDCHVLHPVCAPRLLVSVNGQEKCTGGNPWRRKKLEMTLISPVKTSDGFEVSNGGEGILKYHIECEADWLEIKAGTKKQGNGIHALSGQIEDTDGFSVALKPEKMTAETFGDEGTAKAVIRIYGDNCEETAECSENEYSETRVDIEVQAQWFALEKVPTHTFIECDGMVSMEAVHFREKTIVSGAEWKAVKGFGKTAGGVKVFPVTAKFSASEEAPVISYQVYVKDAGEYELELYTAPANPVVYKGKMCVAVRVNEEDYRVVNTIPDKGYVPWLSDKWSCGVLEQIHKSNSILTLQQGVNIISLKGMDPAVVLEKLVLIRKGVTCPKSYLGPEESLLYEK